MTTDEKFKLITGNLEEILIGLLISLVLSGMIQGNLIITIISPIYNLYSQ